MDEITPPLIVLPQRIRPVCECVWGIKTKQEIMQKKAETKVLMIEREILDGRKGGGEEGLKEIKGGMNE